MRGATSKRSGSAFGKTEGESLKKKKKKTLGRKYTISIAVPGSIIDNAQSLELATSLAGQIARTAAIFQIDEVCVFDEPGEEGSGKQRKWKEAETETGGLFLTKILLYLDTPQYLRKSLIPIKPYFRYAGLLPPLDAPHHARANENVPFREGVIVHRKDKNKDPVPADSEENLADWVNVGLQKEVQIDKSLSVGARVTVCMGDKTCDEINSSSSLSPSPLTLVSRKFLRKKKGLYWGYEVRHARGLSEVINQFKFKNGYDCIIGTSEHGVQVKSSELEIPKFKHLLIVFGGLAGLEESIELDSNIQAKDVKTIFDMYLNTCPSQGSRTIRTEEALIISLSFLQEPIWKSIEQNY